MVALPLRCQNSVARLSVLSTHKGARVALNKGVHQALDDFRWLLKDIASRPTRIAEVVPLNSSAEGHHDASGTGAGGVWFPSSHLNPRGKFGQKPILWSYKWPDDIIANLVTTENPSGTVTNSDLELAGGLIHLEAIVQTQQFDFAAAQPRIGSVQGNDAG